MLQDSFEHILKNQKNIYLNEPFEENHPLVLKLKDEIPKFLVNSIPGAEIEGMAGEGYWYEVPWIHIELNKKEIMYVFNIEEGKIDVGFLDNLEKVIYTYSIEEIPEDEILIKHLKGLLK